MGRKTAWSAGDYVSVGQEIAKLSPAEAGVWMLDEHTGSISNDRDTLATVFERMGRDLVFYGADHWCWNFGFMTDRSETTLLWGNEGNETPLFRALKELWNRAPPGFEVHRIISSSPAIATFDPKRVDVFALVEGSKAVVVVVNDGEKEMSLAIEGVKAEGSTVSIYTGEARRTVGLSSGSKASIPGRSIAFIAADRAK